MRSFVILGVVLAASIVTANVAAADGFYYSEGFGATHVKDEYAAYTDANLFRFRFALGMRSGAWAYEGAVAVNAPVDPYETVDGAYSQSSTLGDLEFTVKYLQPLSRHLELYVRGTAGYGWADGNLHDFSGRSLGVGAGIQLKGRGSVAGLLFWPLFFLVKSGPMMTAGLYLDDGYDFFRLHGPPPTAVDAQLTHLTMGVAVGTDF
ncbi:MAG TPA: hypothetical protein VFQ65_27700 [Kofleriaceae bacterium]|nr:hypothetical protein [Kofleriaceae bacterium]